MAAQDQKIKPVYDILTLFPKMFKGVFDESIIKNAQKENLIEINVHDIRDWAEGKNSTVDDEPYGGGPGMVMKPEPIFKAVEDLKKQYYKTHSEKDVTHVVLLTPKGRNYNFRITEKLSALPHLIFICGHYEGVDHRVFDHLVDERLSIGDYIMTGGEIGAMVMVDSISRHIEGVLGKEESRAEESFQFGEKGLLKHPVYTRPEDFNGLKVPEVLLSGDHAEIDKWKKKQSEKITKEYRPDLLGNTGFF